MPSAAIQKSPAAHPAGDPRFLLFVVQGLDQFDVKPLSAWAFVRYAILFSIPIIGFIFLIVFSISDKNINRRSYARSYWCFMLLLIVLMIASFALSNTHVLSRNTSERIRTRYMQFVDTVYGAAKKLGDAIAPAKEESQTESTYVPFVAPTKAATHPPVSTNSPASAPAAEPTASPTAAPTAAPTAESLLSNAVSPDFKKAMDSYEASIDAYIEVAKALERNPSDIALLQKYTDYMTKYLDAMEKIDQINEDELSTADDLYYLEILNRIELKLYRAGIE